MTDQLTAATTGRFLRLLYGDSAPGHLVVWEKGKSCDFPPAVELDLAAQLAARTNRYFGLGLQPAPLPAGQRGEADQVVAIPGVWADVDIAHPGAHKAPDIPPDLEAAMTIIQSFPLPPTLLVDSGHGIHAYWLFPAPWILDDTNREHAKDLVRRFQDALRAGSEWALDATHDIARVLRAPGSTNAKPGCQPVPVRILAEHPDRRYTVAQLEAAIPKEIPHVPRPAATVDGPIANGNRDATLTSLAGTMRRRGMSEQAILAALREENRRCQPPLADAGVAKIAKSIGKKTPAASHYEMSDLGNARRLVAAHGEDIRHVPQMGRWLVWDGTRWENDVTGEVIRRAKVTLEAILDEARAAGDPDIFRFGLRSQGAAGIRSAIELATTEPGIPVLVDDLDADPWLLTVGNGTVNLRDGSLRPARRDDLITKQSAVVYDPAATCPGWLRFLERILPDPDVRAFIRRLVGCALTGDVSEQILVVLFGTGANGKSVLKETILALLGDHAMPAAPKLLVETRHDEHPTAIADLCGKRLVVSHEVEDGVRLDETLVKELTGGDRLKARFMRADYFSFAPTFKVWMACNHRPRIRGTDRGIWRRIRLVPFEVTIPDDEQDRHLDDKLKAELPGILAWAVAGCLEWQRNGLGAPAAVVDATDAYRRDSDLVGQFLHEACLVGDGYQVRSAELYRAYTAWCTGQGIAHPLTQKALAGRLDEAGFDRTENRARQAVWIGLGVLDTGRGVGGEDRL